MQRTTALVTGASAGLGWQFALELAKLKKYDLVLVARRMERLERLRDELIDTDQESTVRCIQCDLRSTKQREDLLAQLASQSSKVQYLINNAGYGSLGKFSESDSEWEQDMVALNCIAPLHLIRELLPGMIKLKKGTIVNVCSTAAYQAMPYMATYAATKAFLLRFSLGLAVELDKKNITVLAHCPGPTDTEFHEVVGLDNKLDFLLPVSAQKVASEAIAAAESGRRVYINGRLNYFLAMLNRLLPQTISASLVERILRKAAQENQLK